MMIERLAAVAMIVLGACGEASAPPSASASLFAAAPSSRNRLPDNLREISGLALSPDGRLFGHDDETATVSEIDAARGLALVTFSLGEPVESGDFEGLAITPSGDFWLTTSRGRLYRFREGANGEHVAFERFDTGLRDVCEIEGLAYLASEESLILACKTNYGREMRNTIALYSWRVAGSDSAMLWRTLPEAVVATAARTGSFRPSSVEIDPQTGRILVLSARDGAFAEFAADGALIAARRLASNHIQPEGMTVARDGALMIADEGAGGHSLITRYERVP
jgi:uncharacterized protein YjiK